jgi:hypothetical protein
VDWDKVTDSTKMCRKKQVTDRTWHSITSELQSKYFWKNTARVRWTLPCALVVCTRKQWKRGSHYWVSWHPLETGISIYVPNFIHQNGSINKKKRKTYEKQFFVDPLTKSPLACTQRRIIALTDDTNAD